MCNNASPVSLSFPIEALVQFLRRLRQLKERSHEHEPTGNVSSNWSTVAMFGYVFSLQQSTTSDSFFVFNFDSLHLFVHISSCKTQVNEIKLQNRDKNRQ